MSRDKNKDKAQWREIVRLYGRGMTASTVLLAQSHVAHHPKHAVAWLYHGASLAQMSRYPEAISALRRTDRLFPAAQRSLVYFHFGQLYERKGVVRLAEPWYRRAIASCPSDAGYRIMLGRVLHRTGRLQEAAAVLRRAIRCKEGCCEEAFLHLGFALVGLERFSEARRCLRNALCIPPKYQETRIAVSDICYLW